jgi:hypothetical protein
MKQFIVLVYTLIIFIFFGCCSTNRIIDNNGVPKQAIMAKVKTPFQKKTLKEEIKNILRRENLSFSQTRNNFITSPFNGKRSNSFIRYRIHLHNSCFSIYPQTSSKRIHWTQVENCGIVGEDAYEKLTEIISHILTLSIQFNIRRILWCEISMCKQDYLKANYIKHP